MINFLIIEVYAFIFYKYFIIFYYMYSLFGNISFMATENNILVCGTTK